MAEDRKKDQEQQEFDELTVLQDAEKGDLSAEEYERVEGVEEASSEQSDLAGTVLPGSSVHEGDIKPDSDIESPLAEKVAEDFVGRGDTSESPTGPTESAVAEEVVEEPAAEVVEPEVAEGAPESPIDSTESAAAEEAVEEPAAEVSEPEVAEEVTEAPAGPTESAVAEEVVEEPAAEVVEPEVAEGAPESPVELAEPAEPAAAEEVVEELAAEVVEPEVAEEAPESPIDSTESAAAEEVVEEPAAEVSEPDGESDDSAKDSGGQGKQWGRVEDGPDQGKGGDQEFDSDSEYPSADGADKGGPKGNMGLGNGLDEAPLGATEDHPHHDERVEGTGGSDDSGGEAAGEFVEAPVVETGTGDLDESTADVSDSSGKGSGGQGKQWGRVEDGPDQGKGGDQEFDSDSEYSSADGADKGGPKGNMGLGNGLDEAPPGATEDHPHYDERVEGAGDSDDALETDFFLMDSDEGESGSSWTELTVGEDNSSGPGMEDLGNGWTEEVESDDGGGKGKGRGKKGGDDDGNSFEGSDNLDAFENEAEDFPDQSDW